MPNIVGINNSGRGFIMLSNDLADSLCKIDLSSREFRVFLAIFRLTTGWNVEAKRLSADDIANKTNLAANAVSKCISSLLERKVIYRVGGARGDIGICSPNEWDFVVDKSAKTSVRKKAQSAEIVPLGRSLNVPETAQTAENGTLKENAECAENGSYHLYTNKPLVNIPTEYITAPQGAKTPAVTFDGTCFAVDAALLDKWAVAYPSVDIPAELARAEAWAMANRPKKNWQRFLANWISGAAKRGGELDESGVNVAGVIKLYHQACPNFAPVTVESDRTLRSMIVERWRESEQHQSSAFWIGFFEKAARRNQVFYRGQNVVPRLEALVSRAVFREIAEAGV